jgi:hypothetical protein
MRRWMEDQTRATAISALDSSYISEKILKCEYSTVE